MTNTEIIYALRMGDSRFVKVGHTKGDILRRIDNLQIGCPHELRLVGTRQATITDESSLHVELQQRWHRGEWFDFGEMSDAEIRAALALDEVRDAQRRKRGPRWRGCPPDFGSGMAWMARMGEKPR